MTLSELTAIEESRRLKARYFRLLDRKLWGQLLDVFVEDLHVEIEDAHLSPASGGGEHYWAWAGTKSVIVATRQERGVSRARSS